MDITFINQKEWGIDAEVFTSLIERINEAIKSYDGNLNVIFVDDEAIRELNKTHRGIDQPTDVLSFNYDEGDLMGEAYINVPTTKKQAEQNNESFEEELSKLFVHGILHIYGYDHVEDNDYLEMHKKECEILQRDLPLILSDDEF